MIKKYAKFFFARQLKLLFDYLLHTLNLTKIKQKNACKRCNILYHTWNFVI